MEDNNGVKQKSGPKVRGNNTSNGSKTNVNASASTRMNASDSSSASTSASTSAQAVTRTIQPPKVSVGTNKPKVDMAAVVQNTSGKELVKKGASGPVTSMVKTAAVSAGTTAMIKQFVGKDAAKFASGAGKVIGEPIRVVQADNTAQAQAEMVAKTAISGTRKGFKMMNRSVNDLKAEASKKISEMSKKKAANKKDKKEAKTKLGKEKTKIKSKDDAKKIVKKKKIKPVKPAKKATEKAAKKTAKKIATKTVGKFVGKSAIGAIVGSLSSVLGTLLVIFLLIATVGGTVSTIAYVLIKYTSDSIKSFASLEWTAAGKRLAELEEMNWAQYIADETCELMGGTFVETAKTDAQMHYLSGGKQPSQDSSGKVLYDWYCDVGEGNIGYVWMREQCDTVTDKNGVMKTKGATADRDKLYVSGGHLSSISKCPYHYVETADERITTTPNANIVPILSMAHDRYMDEWTWENYQIVEAYVWYMYALSHNTAHYDPPASGNDDANTYSYTFSDMHPKETLFSSEWDWSTKWNSAERILSRPMPQDDGKYYCSECTNIYIHGYNKDDFLGSSDNAKAIIDKAKSTGKKVLSFIDGFLGTDLAEKIRLAGVFHISYKRNTETGAPDFSDATKKYCCNDKWYGSVEDLKRGCGLANAPGNPVAYCDNMGAAKFSDSPSCGIEAHEHTKNCWKKTCVPVTAVAAHCTHDCSRDSAATGCSRRLGDGVIGWNCAHSCPGNSDCPYWGGAVAGHACTGNLDSIAVSSLQRETDFSYGGCNWTKNCDKRAHTHVAQTTPDINNPGCYDIVYFCKGHCGGHIEPSVNIAVTYSFEGLAYQDAVVLDASWMSEHDFDTLIDNLKECRTVAKWSRKAVQSTNGWFKPGPNGPLSALCYAGESLNKGGLKILRWWRNLWLDDEESESYDVGDGSTSGLSSSDYGEDEHDFEGWFEPTDKTKLNATLMDELYDLYGTPEDMYKVGMELWEEFEVEFHIGFGQTYTSKQIGQIVEAITEKYPDLSDQRIAVIRDGLEHAGYFTYKCDAPSHYNGMYGETGPSECTGFVSGVYMRALGSKCGFWNDVSNTFVSPVTNERGAGGSGKGSGGIHRNYGGDPGNPAKLQARSCVYDGVRPQGRKGISRRPGDVVMWDGSYPDGSRAEHGHAMIWLGEYTDPISGQFGNYFVECRGGDGSGYWRQNDPWGMYEGVYSPFADFGIDRK